MSASATDPSSPAVRPTDPKARGKRVAAEAAALLVDDGMTIGLGTGSTVAHFLTAVAARNIPGLRCVATSVRTEQAARALGLPVEPFEALDRLDVAVDGADQVASDLWLVKGGGGAHTREKIVAGAADRFVVIVSPDKLVPAIGPPVPVEVMAFGLAATLRRLEGVGPVRVRDDPAVSPTADGGLLVDYLGPVGDPDSLAQALGRIPGVVEHGLFEPALVSEVLVGGEDGTVRRIPGPRS